MVDLLSLILSRANSSISSLVSIFPLLFNVFSLPALSPLLTQCHFFFSVQRNHGIFHLNNPPLSYMLLQLWLYLSVLPRCWEPARGVPPVAKVMRLRGPTGKGESGLKGTSLDLLCICPKTRVCLLYCVMLSTYSSDINRGLSPYHLFLEKLNLELLDNKSPGHNTSVSIQKPLWWLSSPPAGLIQLHMWLFEASQLREAQEA